ncbi:ABC transporter substrate-binding protein [Lachnotalea sp. AF33-28]|uniref:ABC transporter substrate-binding protein n=1 Tax=Lachnotalea sp. AF33-28 TaxID=2292046 RepID=UPI001314435F|nr:ABC transporter substrate-binding protein [Lachnotalea sp. AF33-28]
MKKSKSLLAILLALSMMLTACSAGTSGNGTEGQGSTGGSSSITIGQVSEVANLNPTLFPRTPDSNVQCMIFDPLVSPTESLEFEGRLAKNWEISDDGKLYTVHLVENAKWHDGEPFTADDVVFTFTSLADPSYIGGMDTRVSSVVGAEEYKAGTADSVAGIQKVDDYTVTFELTEANAAFIAQLYTYILPEHLLKDTAPGEWDKMDFNRAPVGTGKYKFVKWESGQYIQLEKNPDYFGNQPSIDTVYYKFGDATTLTAALINGEVDVVESIESSEIDMLDSTDGASAVTYETMNMYYIGLNQLNENLKDIKVRQALSYALDKEKMIKTVYGEYASATDDIFPTTHWSHTDDVTSYPYDPAKAESLLQEAGYTKNASTGFYEKDGKMLMFTYDMVTKGQAAADMSQLVQQAWQAIGIKVEIREQDFSTLAFTRLLPNDADGNPRAVTADDFDMYTLGFGVEVDPDEYRTYLQSQYCPPNGMNFITYSNPEVDKLFEESIQTTEQSAREECYHKIAKIVSDDIPWIPLYCNISIVGVSDKVQNFAVDFRGITYQIEKWNMAE